MKLSYSQNSFDITFESINYPYQNDIIYEYQLEGSNPEWVRLGSSQTIHLTRLSSGNYQLHVRSISRNGGKVLDTQPAPTDNHAAGSSTATPSSTSTEDAIDTAGKEFVEQATQLILDNLQNSDFNVATLCMEMAMSRTLFYGKLKSYTGTAPQDFIRTIRLERAAALLRQGATVSETAAKTGFVNSKHFSTVFRKQFGTPPSQYQQQ
jgi:AraC-like DNA-binding protein